MGVLPGVVASCWDWWKELLDVSDAPSPGRFEFTLGPILSYILAALGLLATLFIAFLTCVSLEAEAMVCLTGNFRTSK